MTEIAPDGGPAPRRATSDPMLQLSLELTEQRRDTQRLHDQHVQLASDVSEMGAQVASVRQQVDGLGTAVSRLADAVAGDQDDEDAARPRPVDWWLLDHQQATDAWNGLWEWCAEYLVPTFQVTRDELVDCWPRHPALRDMLTSMWIAQRAATDAKRSRATADIEWQLRYRPEGLRMLGELAGRLGCAAGRCSLAGTSDGPVPGDGEITRPELWHTEGIENDLASRPEPGESR